MLFEKFGEFDSVDELNRAAAAQLAEGEREALLLLAEENGIDREDAEDYMDGVMPELATPLMAAIGKLKLEKEEYQLKGVLAEWVDDIMGMCGVDPAMCAGVRRTGKGLDGYVALLVEKGYQDRVEVDKRIVRKTKQVKNIVGTHPLSIGVPDRRTRKELAEKYYLGEEDRK